MSYILEALKKDQAASDPAAAAALALARSRPKRTWGLWVLGIALLISFVTKKFRATRRRRRAAPGSRRILRWSSVESGGSGCS